jgi:hypothetical protein
MHHTTSLASVVTADDAAVPPTPSTDSSREANLSIASTQSTTHRQLVKNTTGIQDRKLRVQLLLIFYLFYLFYPVIAGSYKVEVITNSNTFTIFFLVLANLQHQISGDGMIHKSLKLSLFKDSRLIYKTCQRPTILECFFLTVTASIIYC